jgi:hypothetical protein
MSNTESEQTSSFIFDITNTTPNVNFINKDIGWLSCINCKNYIQLLLNKLIKFVNEKNYKYLNKELKYLYDYCTVFLTPNDCKLGIIIFNKLMSLRNFLYKCVYPTLNTDSFNKYSGLYNKKKLQIANTQDLAFNDFNSSDPNLIEIVSSNRIYQMRVSEILTIYRYATYNIDYSIPTPLHAKNPYTNEEVTIKQHYEIYTQLLKYYCSIGKSLPEHYILLKNSYFDMEIFKKKYHCYLLYKSTHDETEALSKSDWLLGMDDYCSELSSYCKLCFFKTHNVREMFKGILELFILNEHDVYTYGDAEVEYLKIAKKNNLVFDSKHEKYHRRFLRARRPRTSGARAGFNNMLNELNEESTNSLVQDIGYISSNDEDYVSDTLTSNELPLLPSEDNESL